VVAGKPPDERVAGIVDPFDDINKFAAELIEQSHVSPLDVFLPIGS
jgi:hypothetical protein